jgi:hypothetical protein
MIAEPKNSSHATQIGDADSYPFTDNDFLCYLEE